MAKMPILVLNSGSSSIKFSIYDGAVAPPALQIEGAVDGIGSSGFGRLMLRDGDGTLLRSESRELPDSAAAFELVVAAVASLADESLRRPLAIGHRLVCGAPSITENAAVTPERLYEIEHYSSLAPLHTPIAAYIMRHALRLFPDVPNFFCLDSYFHRTLPEVAGRLPIPAKYSGAGVRRIGAHGLSYESIVVSLAAEEGLRFPERLIIAHLGNGASVSAVLDGRCVDTSMGLTPTGGIISATRTGDLDPGVLIYVLRDLVSQGHSSSDAADQLEALVTRQSGLLGVSEQTNDMRALREAITAGDAKARLAVDLFVQSVRKCIGSYVAVLGGLDMLVFTGGIGENDAACRAEICSGLACFGILLETERNGIRDSGIISPEGSSVSVRVIPPAEDLMIVCHVLRLLQQG